MIFFSSYNLRNISDFQKSWKFLKSFLLNLSFGFLIDVLIKQKRESNNSYQHQRIFTENQMMANLVNYLCVAVVYDYRFLKIGSVNFQGGPLGSLNFFSLIKFSRHLGDNSKEWYCHTEI